MFDWLIRSKLAPSTSGGSLVARERLICKLDASLKCRAAVLHAPAGYGKTSLLVHWHRSLAARNIPTAWLSLDENDRDLFHFLTYLMESCRFCGLIPGAQLLPPPGGVAGARDGDMVGAVLTELGKCSGEAVLILDDFHRAESLENCRAVNQFFSRLPSNVHIVLSTREYPVALSLADLRARDDLLEVDHASLEFSESEICSWLGPLIDDSATDDWPSRLRARTEGWPIALSTVRRWLFDGAPSQETFGQLSGRSSDLSDYFLEQVFHALDPSVQTFLLKTSILERVHGDLANLLCESEDGWETLEELERRDLFVHSLDRERVWYRYHRLFAEFLQERMRRRSDCDSAHLHKVACGWFEERGFVTEAVQHGLTSGDPGIVADLFESLGGWHHALKGHVGVLDRALSVVDDETLATHPRLWLGKIFLTVRRGETKKAEALFERLAARLEEAVDDDAEIDSELSIMRSLLNRYADNDITDGELDRLERLSETLAPDNDLMHAVRCNLLCVMHAQRGSFDACMVAGDKAIRHFRAMGSVFGEAFIYFHEGYACMVQGRLRDAEVLYEAGRDLALEHFGEDNDLAAIAGALLAETAYQKNNLPEAKRLLDASLPHIERFDAWLEVYVAAYTTAMKLARFAPERETVAEIRARARATAISRRLPRLRAIVDMQELELDYLSRDGQRGDRSREGVNSSQKGVADHSTLHRLRISVQARSLLRSGDIDNAAGLLEHECRKSQGRGLVHSLISQSILLAVARWRQGAHEAAVTAFEEALAPSLFEGIKRPFIDEGEALVEVVGDLTRASESRRGNRLRDRFLAELTMEIGATNSQPESGSDDLTPREREVLRYLVQGRSNREIAEAIPVSVNTVKFHLKNIFGKLGVSTRQDAVSASIRRRNV